MGRDSLNTPDTPDLIRRDWIEGDTIVATFAPAPDSMAAATDEGRALVLAHPDSTRVSPQRPLPPPQGGENPAGEAEASFVLERLSARGSARSLYRMEASDSTLAADGRLAVHYVVGEEITIYLVEGEVERMEVRGQTQGTHLEPLPPGRRREGEDPGASRSGGAADPPPAAVRRSGAPGGSP
jgi:hypothetical protein